MTRPREYEAKQGKTIQTVGLFPTVVVSTVVK